MSTIGGIGSYGGISLSGFRNKQSEQQDELALMKRNLGRTHGKCRVGTDST